MGDLNILIVEDEEFTLEFLKTIFSNYFSNIYVASNGEKALEIFKKEQIDIIITDIEMPVMNGIEMAKHIKKINPFIPIIAATAYDNKNILKELINANFDAYFQKPIKVEEVIQKIKEIVCSKKFNLYKTEYLEPLTKCRNRKFFNNEFEKIILNSESSYLIFIDLNGFKQINDTFGHNFGDEVLKEFGKRLLKSIRKDDICIRYGGDEFIIVVKNNNIEELLKRLVSNCNFEFNNIKISASIGVARYPNDAKEPCELLMMADNAMYKSKKEKLPFYIA